MPAPTKRKRLCEYYADTFVNVVIFLAVLVIIIKAWEEVYGF